jgi:hypothetical protein
MSTDLTLLGGDTPDFDALALMHLDGLLDPVTHAEFSQQVANDPAKALRLAHLAEQHAALGELGRTSLAKPRLPPAHHTPGTGRRSRRMPAVADPPAMRRHLPVWAGAAAALLVVGVVLGIAMPHLIDDARGQDTLTVTAGQVVLERHGVRTRIGPSSLALQAGDRVLSLPTATASIATLHGDHLVLDGRTLLTWGDGIPTVDLGGGALTAAVAPRTARNPFTVRTPKADLLVLGTKFTVQADDGLSLLAVDHGRVRLTNRDDAQQIEVAANQHTVTAGHGALVANAGTPPVAAESGLTGDYFTGTRFDSWRLRRVDPAIDFDWGEGGPDPRVGGQRFSVRWRGWLVPAHDGPHTFTFLMDDGVRLWLDGRLVLDEWHLTEMLEFSTTVHLVAGRAYAVRLDYFQAPKFAVIRWFYSTPTQAKQVLPGSWLRPVEWVPER